MTTAPAAPSRPFFGPAIAGFCGLLIGVGMGRFGYPPLIPSMVEAGWAAPATLHLAGAFNLAGYVVGAVTALPAARLLGVRPAIALAAILATLAFAGSAVPLPGWLFIALRALSGFTGGLMMIVLPPVIGNVVAPSHRGRAGGLAFAGVGTGFVLSGTAVPLLAGGGPAPAWIALSLALELASIILIALMPRSPPPQHPVAGAGKPVRTWHWTGPFVGLALAYCGAAVGYVPHTLFFVDHVARDLGHGLAAGGWVWIAAGLTAVAAPLVAGFAADRFGFALALRIVVGLMALGALMPAFTSALPLLIVSAMLCGGLMIGLGSLAAGRTREIVGAEAHAGAWAVQTILFALAQAAAAYGFTALLAATHNHALVFASAGAIMAAGLAVDMAMARR